MNVILVLLYKYELSKVLKDNNIQAL